MRLAHTAWLAAAAWSIAPLAEAAAQEAGDHVVVDTAAPRDLYLAGQQIEVLAPVTGDVVAAGGSVRVGAPVSGDVIVAGASVVVAGPVEDDVRAAGRDVVIASPVEGHLVAAGESVTLTRGQSVQDWAWLAGEHVRVSGSVGELRAVGDSVTLAGEVRGDAEVEGTTVRLAPGAVVRGDLRWASPGELIVGEGARVEGAVVRREWTGGGDAGAMMLGALALVLGMVVSLVLLVVVAPRGTRLVAARARTAAGRSLLVGLAVIVLTPPIAVLALLSGLLWVVGAILIAAYVLALMLGGLLGIIAIADLGLELRGHPVAQASATERAAATALAAVVFAGVAMIPVVGPIVLAVLTVLGVGALVLAAWRAQRASVERELIGVADLRAG